MVPQPSILSISKEVRELLQKHITKSRVERLHDEKKQKSAKRKASAWRIADWVVRLILAVPQLAETFTKFFG